MTAPLLKGALVQYSPTFAGFTPNVVLFQYNPDSVRHEWTQMHAAGNPGQPGANPLAVSGVPGEQFTFTLHLDANEDLATAPSLAASLALTAGIAPRIAAIEMMLYPNAVAATGAASGLLGTVTAQAAGNQVSRAVPGSSVPLVMLVMGSDRVVGVRISSLTITETYFDPALNPVRADVDMSLDVLTPAELASARSDNDAMAELASAAYAYTLGRRQVLGVVNMTGASSAVLSMIPH